MAGSGTTKQKLYTAALLALGERKYLTTEAKEAVRVLDDIYDDALEECLVQGYWNFATTYTVLNGDTGIAITDTGGDIVGLRYGFTLPSGYLRTAGISGDEYFSYPLTQYIVDNDIIRADYTPIYLRYVSNDTGLGLELTSWPRLFTRYVELELATRVCMRLTQNDQLFVNLMKMRDQAKTKALNLDATDEAQPKFPPSSSWTYSRWGRSSGRDVGSRNKLTG
jgi:hypothetical protein